MARTAFPTRPKMVERIRVALSPDDKEALFRLAAERRQTVSEFVREAVAAASGRIAA
jgi:uncharacterized protein (DUF1778 family)